MNFNEIAKALGIEKYPEALDKVYENLSPDTNVADRAFLDDIHREYNALGIHYDIIMKTAEELSRDELRFTYANTVAEYIKTCTVDEARAVPMPETDGTAVGDMMPLYILLSAVPTAAEEYLSRGFTKEETLRVIAPIWKALDTVNTRFNMFGINYSFYNWLCIYIKCRIFDCGIFNIEVAKFPGAAIILKKRGAEKYAPVMIRDRYHKSGQVLGSAGCTDEEGAFGPDFTETDDAYIGYTTKRGLVQNELKTFKKSKWECFLRPGDDIISLHIPKGADLSPENIKNSVDEALSRTRERFPECAPRCAFCNSWLLEPAFLEILGEKSKIVGFGNTFLRYPGKSGGKELFSFVFPGKDPDNYAELNEDTSLQRKVKQLYLDGGFIHGFCGVIV